MDHPIAYLPMDRRFALAGGYTLADRIYGAALFVDISGFTQLTEALVRELGAQRGAEELTRYLNLVYDAVIDELHRYGGSVIAFAGDAITCWIDGDAGDRATACALAMQSAMQQFAAITTPAGSTVSLAMKAAVAIGPARRFLVGDPAQRVIDALAGETLVRLANAEHQAQRGEVVLDSPVLAVLGDQVEVQEMRRDAAHDQTVGVVRGLRQPVAPTPWPPLDPAILPPDAIRIWLLPQVYERLSRGLGNFLAELRPTVALFVRFGGIDYNADAAAGEKLDSYMRWVQAIVAHYEGTLIDLNIGDKGSYLYISFGAPLAHEDNADRAAATALALRNQPPELRYIGQVQMGISQGRMRAGAYGGTHHRTYGVLGDEVNMAARLMMAAQPGQILVSEAARRSLRANFVLDDLPPIRVKGKSAPALIFALSGIQQERAAFGRATYALPMIRRQAELARVAEKLALAAQGHGQVVGLMGEAGMGKSRLVAEVLRLESAQAFALYGSECESYGVNSSYLVWQPIWRAFFGVESSWPLARQISVLQAQLQAINPTFVARVPLLEAVLNLEIPDNELTQGLDPKLRKSLLEGLLVDCLRARARQRPLLLVLEACQWLDPLSYELLEMIVLASAELPICLLCTYRLQEDETRARAARANTLPYYTEIALGALTPPEAAELIRWKVAQLLGSTATLPATLIERLTQQAEGNPFYLEELLTYLHYRGVDFQQSTALDQVELPDSLQRLMLSLLDQFSESQKITVKVASVVGRLFRAAWLYGVYPELGDSERVRADLAALHQQELMLPETGEPELTYLFRQVLTQSVTYESLPHALKTTFHEQIGKFIEQTYPTALDQYLDLLAYHYDRSANSEKQRHYLRRAGEAAQAVYANVTALNYFTRLLALLPAAEQSGVLLKLGQIYDTVGNYAEAESRFQAALTLATEQVDRLIAAQCQIALGELRRKQSQYAEAATYFTQAQQIAEQIGDQAGVAKALVCAGSLALYQGDYAAAQRNYLQSLSLRRQLDDQPNIANVLNNLAITAANQGDLAGSSALFAESLAIRRSLGDQWGVANSLNNLGELALMQEAYAEARPHLEEAVKIYQAIGDKWSLGNSVLTLGNVLRAQGDDAAAYPLYQESLQIYRELGDRRALAYLLESMGALLSLQGQPTRALRLVGAAARLRTTLKTPLSSAEQSQLDQALEPARQALGDAATTAWEAGRALSLEQAIGEALGS
jgi:predicted ATPase/class 3 adenylate cyclase